MDFKFKEFSQTELEELKRQIRKRGERIKVRRNNELQKMVNELINQYSFREVESAINEYRKM